MTIKDSLHGTPNEFEQTGTSAQVVVLGSLHLDILVHAPDRPKKGETLPGRAWGYKAGGKGGNQAVAAAQFGARTSMVGRVGNDDFGKRLLSHLRDAGVDAEHVYTDPEAGSGMSVAIIDAEGDYGAVIVSGANLRLIDKDIEEAREVIRNAQVLVLQNEVLEVTNLAAAHLAKRCRVRVILNAAPARRLRPDLSANVDLLVVNAVEAEMICGVAVTSLFSAAEAAALLSNQVANVVVTAGGLGLAMAERGKTTHTEAAHPVKLVDTHGAGDAFIGALAARWASGVPLAEAIRFANSAAALFVSTPAGQKKTVTSDQVTRFLSECRQPMS
ncbi:MAG: ribokinase [Verrucomicrobia bacterium]|nr:ribokinase [Verrucomicrobiota bacterium]